MSYRRLNVEITGTSRGLEAALNRINAGLGATQNRVRQTRNEMGLWERQIMAIGTTARYALAGSFVFGVTAAISRLTDFQNQLGQVAGLAGKLNEATGQYTGPSKGFLAGVGDDAILESNKLGIATDDIQSYMTRFFSSFQPARGQARTQLRGFVDEVARLQALLGAEAGDPQQLAGGIAGLVNQIRAQPGGKRQDIAGTTNRVANLISYMLAVTPNMTGRDISRDIGRIGATMTQANMTPEQAFAVWGQAGKAGGSASVIGRGIAQLLGTSLLRPVSPASKKAYESIGLPTDPNMLARLGGMEVLTRMLKAVGGRSNLRIRNRSALSNENIDDADALRAAGVSGVDRTLLYNLFGRQESVRQFINLLGQDGVRGLQHYIDVQKKATDANAVRAREDAAQAQRALARFNTARQNIGLGLARGVQWPLENIVAPPVGFVSDEITKHRTATQVALGALFGAMAVKSTGKLINSFRRGGATPGQELTSSLLATEALPNVLAGGATDGTRANPYWVIIHPDSWYVGSPGGRPGGGFGSETNPEKNAVKSLWNRISDPLKAAAAAAAVGVRRNAIPTLKYGGTRIAPKVMRGPLGLAALTALAFPEDAGAHIQRGFGDYDLSALYPNVNWDRFGMLNLLTRGGGDPNKTRMFAPILNQFANRRIGPARAEQMLERMARQRGLHLETTRQTDNGKRPIQLNDMLDRLKDFDISKTQPPVGVHGHTTTDITIKLVDEQGRPIKTVTKKGVPTKLIPDKQAPTYRGKPRAGSTATSRAEEKRNT